jgi:hypothetical protein
LSGNDRPLGAAESSEFAQLCSCKLRYAAAARLWSDAFAALAELALDLDEENRYQTARAAALPGCGLG